MNKIEPGSEPKLTLGGYIAEHPLWVPAFLIMLGLIVATIVSRNEMSENEFLWLLSSLIALPIFCAIRIFFDIRKKNKLRI